MSVKLTHRRSEWLYAPTSEVRVELVITSHKKLWYVIAYPCLNRRWTLSVWKQLRQYMKTLGKMCFTHSFKTRKRWHRWYVHRISRRHHNLYMNKLWLNSIEYHFVISDEWAQSWDDRLIKRRELVKATLWVTGTNSLPVLMLYGQHD